MGIHSLPEMIDGLDWEVRDSGSPEIGYVNFTDREMVVPLDGTIRGEYIRAHEAAHVAITPRDPERLPKDIENRTIQAVEDCRVNAALKIAGVQTEAVQHWLPEMIARWAEGVASGRCDVLEQARVLMAKAGLADERIVRGIASPAAQEIADRAMADFLSPVNSGQLPSFDETLRIARMVEAEAQEQEQQQGDSGSPDPQGEQQQGQSSPGDSDGEGEQEGSDSGEDQGEPQDGSQEQEEGCSGDDQEEQEEGESEATGQGEPKTDDDVEEIAADFSPEGSGNASKLGELTPPEEQEIREADLGPAVDRLKRAEREKAHAIKYSHREIGKYGRVVDFQTPRLESRINFKRTRTVKSAASDCGSIPKGMHRYATDQRIFTRTSRRLAGVAVLIDCSGSMGLGSEDLREIIEQCPAAVVAVYSGFGAYGRAENGKDGIIRVVAEGSRMTKDLDRGMGGENVIDLPALEWLARRKEKTKLWISDAKVTGEGSCTVDGKELRKTARLIKHHRIQRVGDVKSLIRSGKLIDRGFDDGNKLGRDN